MHGEAARGPALWLTERGGRISARRIDERFAQWRAAAGLPAELVGALPAPQLYQPPRTKTVPTRLRPAPGRPRFWASTTAIYTTVGADHVNRAMRAALDRAFGAEEESQ